MVGVVVFYTMITTCLSNDPVDVRCGKVVMSPKTVDVMKCERTRRNVRSSHSFKAFWTV